MAKAFAAKLMEVTERHARDIAENWCRDVVRNPRTPSYHGISRDKLTAQAMEFYDNFSRMFLSPKPYREEEQYFTRYAEFSFRDNIPMHEALYALILMRRHIWLYAQFQAIFTTAVELQQAVESLNHTILLFDYAIYIITRRYQELACS
ncbi:MAG TPA: hypothetical protein PK587_10315 [Syntrophales bacterium]|nr:hypothetical protein [Syntrophales bacterium]